MRYKYTILDSRGARIAHGLSNDSPDKESWHLIVQDDNIDRVMKYEFVNLLGAGKGARTLEAKIISHDGDKIVVQAVRMRENLRMPTRFDSFIFPVTGNWEGRLAVVGEDLSCGGVAFSCDRILEVNEKVDIVIPVTSQPIVMTLEVLRRIDRVDGMEFYASKFVDMLHEEEVMIREAVFALQLRDKAAPYIMKMA